MKCKTLLAWKHLRAWLSAIQFSGTFAVSFKKCGVRPPKETQEPAVTGAWGLLCRGCYTCVDFACAGCIKSVFWLRNWTGPKRSDFRFYFCHSVRPWESHLTAGVCPQSYTTTTTSFLVSHWSSSKAGQKMSSSKCCPYFAQHGPSVGWHLRDAKALVFWSRKFFSHGIKILLCLLDWIVLWAAPTQEWTISTSYENTSIPINLIWTINISMRKVWKLLFIITCT